MRSGHGVGKTTLLAWAIIWWLLTRFPQKTVCTAPTADQLFDALASETKTWIGKLPPALKDQIEVQAEKIFLKPAPEESFVSFATSRPDKPEALAGKHSANVLLIGDEASGIPDPVYAAAAGSMSGHSAVTVLAGNPTRSSGYFYDTFHTLSPEWENFHISCVGHPRVSEDFIRQIRLTYGERHNEYRVRVLGEFPLGDDDTVIPADVIRSALERDVQATHVQEIWGVDVARFGDDATALARRKGNVLVRPVEEKRGYDMMAVAGWVKAQFDTALPSDRPSEIFVDVIGIGAGVVDRLQELGLPVRGINVSESPALYRERYLNQRAELWFKGLDWFNARDCNLANDKALAAELMRPRYKHTSSGKLQVESKEALKERLGKRDGISPNKADAFLLTLAGDAVTAIGTSKTRSSWKTPLHRVLKGHV